MWLLGAYGTYSNSTSKYVAILRRCKYWFQALVYLLHVYFTLFSLKSIQMMYIDAPSLIYAAPSASNSGYGMTADSESPGDQRDYRIIDASRCQLEWLRLLLTRRADSVIE
jgi:hypothetical protein